MFDINLCGRFSEGLALIFPSVPFPSLKGSFCAESGAHLSNLSICNECDKPTTLKAADKTTIVAGKEAELTEEQQEDGVREGQETVAFKRERDK